MTALHGRWVIVSVSWYQFPNFMEGAKKRGCGRPPPDQVSKRKGAVQAQSIE
jgi:hypothetical protein